MSVSKVFTVNLSNPVNAVIVTGSATGIINTSETTSPPPTFDTSIVQWGDSMTTFLGATRISNLLGGRNVVNKGVGGQRSLEIAGRQTGVPVTAEVIGGQIPASTVAIGVTRIGPSIPRGMRDGLLVNIKGVEGILRPVGSNSLIPTGYEFIRSTAGSAVDVQRNEPVFPITTETINEEVFDLNSYAAILWVGRNGIGGPNETDVTVYEKMISKITGSPIMILPIFNGGYSNESSGQSGYISRMDINAGVATAFPDYWYDVRRDFIDGAEDWLKKNDPDLYASDWTKSFTASPDIRSESGTDSAWDVLNDVPPRIFRRPNDRLHLSDRGNDFLAELIVKKFREMEAGGSTVQLPAISLSVSPSSVQEDGTANLVFTFTRTGSTANSLAVNYTVGGTATLGTDYTGIPSSGTTKTIIIPAGSSTATVIVDPVADTVVESDETVILTLASGSGYTITTTSPVTGTIINDDSTVQLPAISLSVSPSSVQEDGTANLVFTFTRTGSTTSSLTVNYTVGGTATLGTDYTGIPSAGTTKTVTIPVGSLSTTVVVDPVADTVVESNETVILTLASGSGYTITTTSPVTGTIVNDDSTVSQTDTLPAFNPASVDPNLFEGDEYLYGDSLYHLAELANSIIMEDKSIPGTLNSSNRNFIGINTTGIFAGYSVKDSKNFVPQDTIVTGIGSTGINISNPHGKTSGSETVQITINKGYITANVWRKGNNVPGNARVLENHVALTFFYTSTKPWNIYRGNPILKNRLEAVLEFLISPTNLTIGTGSVDGKSNQPIARLGSDKKIGDPNNNELAGSGFGVKYLGETLLMLEQSRLAGGPTINEDLRQRVITATRQIIRTCLGFLNFKVAATRFSNQYTGFWGGTLAFLEAHEDAELRQLLDERIAKLADKDNPEIVTWSGSPLKVQLSSPAGYHYENSGPDWAYVFTTNYPNIKNVLNYKRGTSFMDPIISIEQPWVDWLSYNAAREPDGSYFVLNRAIQSRIVTYSGFSVEEFSLSESIPMARAFGRTQTEHNTFINGRRQTYINGWNSPKTLRDYNPGILVDKGPERFQWRPTAAQKSAAIASLPYIAQTGFVHQRSDSKITVTFVRRPTYYAIFNSGSTRSYSIQRYGLGLVWNPEMGTVLQTQSSSVAPWGTSREGTSVPPPAPFEVNPFNPVIKINGQTQARQDGARDLPNGQSGLTTFEYSIMDGGQKTVTFNSNKIDVSITLSGGFFEQLAMITKPSDTLTITPGLIRLTRGSNKFEITFPTTVTVTQRDRSAAGWPPSGFSIITLVLRSSNSLTYSMAFS